MKTAFICFFIGAALCISCGPDDGSFDDSEIRIFPNKIVAQEDSYQFSIDWQKVGEDFPGSAPKVYSNITWTITVNGDRQIYSFDNPTNDNYAPFVRVSHLEEGDFVTFDVIVHLFPWELTLDPYEYEYTNISSEKIHTVPSGWDIDTISGTIDFKTHDVEAIKIAGNCFNIKACVQDGDTYKILEVRDDGYGNLSGVVYLFEGENTYSYYAYGNIDYGSGEWSIQSELYFYPDTDVYAEYQICKPKYTSPYKRILKQVIPISKSQRAGWDVVDEAAKYRSIRNTLNNMQIKDLPSTINVWTQTDPPIQVKDAMIYSVGCADNYSEYYYKLTHQWVAMKSNYGNLYNDFCLYNNTVNSYVFQYLSNDKQIDTYVPGRPWSCNGSPYRYDMPIFYTGVDCAGYVWRSALATSQGKKAFETSCGDWVQCNIAYFLRHESPVDERKDDYYKNFHGTISLRKSAHTQRLTPSGNYLSPEAKWNDILKLCRVGDLLITAGDGDEGHVAIISGIFVDTETRQRDFYNVMLQESTTAPFYSVVCEQSMLDFKNNDYGYELYRFVGFE